jgi:hypothetical protein
MNMPHSVDEELLEKLESVDQKVRDAVSLIRQQADVFSHQGSVQESWRSYKGRQLGPYYRLVFRTVGQQRSIYLGSDQDGAALVRETLQLVQQKPRRQKSISQCRKAVRAELRKTRRQLQDQPAAVGLRIQGAEIRGWYSARPQTDVIEAMD